MSKRAAPHYYHRQTSIKAMLLFIPVTAIVGGAFVLVAQERKPAIALLLAVLTFVAVVVVVFSTLTVTIDGEELSVGFLLGVMRRRMPLADIVRAERTTVPWWYGTGVKYSLTTTSYLVFPGPAVSLELKSGRFFRISTEDAGALLAVLAQSGVRTG
jgi:hypothetical protein